MLSRRRRRIATAADGCRGLSGVRFRARALFIQKLEGPVREHGDDSITGAQEAVRKARMCGDVGRPPHTAILYQ